MDKPTKPTDLVPRSFGGVKNNFSASLQSSGYEDGVPAIYGGDNLNYQIDATGKELDYCEKICDYINAIPINKTPIVDANNKLAYTQYDIKVYNSTDTYGENELVTGIVDGVKHIYRSKQNGNIGQALTNDVYWERTDILGGVKTIGRNIGEIVPSTIPLTDAGLHLLDGSLIQGSGTYSDFVDYITDLYDSGDYDDIFETEANWQQSATTYGVCGKFVYDSVNNTVRLPKITGFVEGTTDVTALGDLTEAGLPNITGFITQGMQGGPATYTGAFYKTGLPFDGVLQSGYIQQTNIGFDASLSNSIYGNSTTVQPQSIKVLYYIVIATSTKTDIQVDIDEIATDLNGKADTDLTNCTDVANIKMAHNAMPSSTYEDLTLGASGTEYTAPADGYVVAYKFVTAAYQYFNLQTGGNTDDTVKIQDSRMGSTAVTLLTCTIPVLKNEKFYTVYNAGGATKFFRFYYAVGSESEAS